MQRKTIRKHHDFLTKPSDLTATCHCISIKTKKMVKKDARYGLVAPKRVFKTAVERNRAKRLMRDWIAYNENMMLPDLDYIFIAHISILDCPREIGRKKLYSALKKIKELHDEK